MKQTKALFIMISLMLVFSVVAAACGNNGNTPGQGSGGGNGGQNQQGGPAEPIVLKVSHNLATSETIHVELEKLAERLNEKSEGRLEVQIYPGAQLGNSKDGLEQAMRGSNVVVVTDTAYIADYVPDYSIMNGPFLYDDYTEILKLADSQWHEEIMAATAEQGIKILSMNWYFGSRYLISGKVVEKPEDLKGMKVRVPQNKMWVETLSAMGSNPTQLDLSEVYSGLSQGVVDAAEAPLSTIYGNNWHEVKKHIAATGHFRAFLGLEMSQTLFDSMPADLQTMLVEEVKLAGEETSRIVAQSEEEWMAKLEAEGAIFNDVDVEAFKQATEVVYTKFPEWSDGLFERIKGELAK